MFSLKKIDRRYIFVLIFLGVAIPLIIPFGLKVELTENVKMAYDMVESAPANSKVILSFDYDPASKPELHPMAKAVMRHCLNNGHKLIFTALWPMGVSMANDVVDQLKEDFPNLKYGEDYVDLGYKAGGIVTIQAMGKNMREIFPTDANRKPIDDFLIMDGVNSFDDLSFVFSFSAGDPGIKQWVQVAHDKYNLDTSGGTTAVSAPAILPYVPKQLAGLLGGLKAAAEYEALVEAPGTATSGMDAQSIAHLIIILFIIIGNVNYWLSEKNKQNLAVE